MGEGSIQQRRVGAGGRGDARADFEPAILPFQGVRREAVAADHFHTSAPVQCFSLTLRAAAVEELQVSVFSLKTYASFRPSAPPAAFGDRAGQPPRVPDGRAARYLAVKRKR